MNLGVIGGQVQGPILSLTQCRLNWANISFHTGHDHTRDRIGGLVGTVITTDSPVPATSSGLSGWARRQAPVTLPDMGIVRRPSAGQSNTWR